MTDSIAFFALIFVVVVLPIALIGGAEVLKRYIAYREKQLELTAGKTAEKAAQYAAQVERLEARMRVLERIATDKGVELADEIEDLRDDKLN
jgi:hypothetical protein